MTTKPQAMIDIESSFNFLNQTLSRLSPRQRGELTDAAGWTATDHVIHLALWERSVAGVLQGKARHDALTVTAELYHHGGYDAINEVLRQRHRHLDWDAAIAFWHANHHDLLVEMKRHDDEALSHAYQLLLSAEDREDDDRSALALILANTVGHYQEHLAWIEALAGI